MTWIRNQIAYALVRLAAAFVVNGSVSITHDTTPGNVRHFMAERRDTKGEDK